MTAYPDDRIPQIIACHSAPDRALCLLSVAAGGDEGAAAIWRDEDLRRAPAIIAALGLTRERVAAARAASEGEARVYAARDEAADAVDDALALDRAGRPPAEALAPILALSPEPHHPPLPFFVGAMASARTEAFAALLARDLPPDQRPSVGLARAAAAAWEAALSAPDLSANDRRAAFALGLAYQALDDAAAIDRAMALLPFEHDRLTLTLSLGRLDEAAARLAALTPDDLAADSHAELLIQAAQVDGHPLYRTGELTIVTPDDVADFSARMLSEVGEALIWMALRAGRTELVADRLMAQDINPADHPALQPEFEIPPPDIDTYLAEAAGRTYVNLAELIAVAKVALRADGRLPPVARPPEQ